MREPDRPSAKQWWATRIGSYEHRFHLWCHLHERDPEDLGSVLDYEREFGEDDLPSPYDYNP